MKETALSYLKIARDVTISPFAFFRALSVKEGVRDAVYFLTFIYLLRGFGNLWQSYERGYYLVPEIKVSPVFTTGALVFTLASPVLFMIMLYVQSLYVVRFGAFFGGVGNLEGAFKLMAFTMFISLLMFIPVLGAAARLYAFFVMIVGIHEVFRVDWISSVLILFFSWLFTVVLYIFVFVPPALLSGILAPF